MRRAAPNFELPDQNGKIHTLGDYTGKWLVVFFYPKDGSLNCTREVCAFQDEYNIIKQFGNAEVVGVNSESVGSHKHFSDKQGLSFPLLSDDNGKVTKAFGAWRGNKPKLYDIVFPTRRNTYLVNPEGQIIKEYIAVDPIKHPEEVIQDLQKLQTNMKRTAGLL